MSESKLRQFHTSEFKAKIGLESLRGIKTLNEITLEFDIHPAQVGQWKKQIQDHDKTLKRSTALSRLRRTVSLICYNTARLVN